VSEEIELRLTSLEERVTALEPPKRRNAIETGSCRFGVADPASCSLASLHHRRMGCQGEACKHKSSEYYKNYRRVASTQPDE
jgi:hypothetical protein